MTVSLEEWKLKRLVKRLKAAEGAGTSMISLAVPPGAQIAPTVKMLADEAGAAANIKSRVNRLSVQGAITSTIQRLKLYSKAPPNGLALFCGTAVDLDGKSRKLVVDVEPFRPLSRSMYLCDSRFHTELLEELITADRTVTGFIVADGNGALFGTVCGAARAVLHQFAARLPGKTRRGGQSALRYARLRAEARHEFLRKVADTAAAQFLQGGRPTVARLVLAGAAAFKDELAKSALFDARLKELVVATLAVSYGGRQGFEQAIALAADHFADAGLAAEQQVLARFMSELAQDTGRYCFGLADTCAALELGAAETVIAWEGLELAWPAADAKEEDEYETALDWLVAQHQAHGAELVLVTDASPQGTQFRRGFGGLGCILRWPVEFADAEFADAE